MSRSEQAFWSFQMVDNDSPKTASIVNALR
jgi:hypothetical protein